LIQESLHDFCIEELKIQEGKENTIMVNLCLKNSFEGQIYIGLGRCE
jgi:hypothetical protein